MTLYPPPIAQASSYEELYEVQRDAILAHGRRLARLV